MSSFSEADEGNVKESNGLGALSCNLPEVDAEGCETFYITTAIAYMNGYPHIGHAYEFITTDCLARLHRLLGFDTYFLTGADEHGQKVENSAIKIGRTPKEHCDHYVNSFQELNRKLAISNSSYIRTTDDRHIVLAQTLWEMCAASDDIYLHFHEGWYNPREECYVTELEAQANNYKDPGTGLDYTRLSEETYFFKMSKYQDRLIAFLEENPGFIEPEQARGEIMSRLRSPDGLKDVCISRTTFSWGIPVPEGFDDKHIMYVWFDALSNYLTGVDALDKDSELSKYWPADKHIIGKDIKWFHCVIWPTMLMSAGLPLPKQVFCHGFVNAADGRKMSKTFNNTIDPWDILSRYPLDTIRYYIISTSTYGADLNFSEDALVMMHNSELADVLGNLMHRATNLCHKYCGGLVPDVEHDSEFSMPFNLADLKAEASAIGKSCALSTLAFTAMDAVRATNRFLTEAEPWKMKGENEVRRVAIVRTTLEAIYAFSHFLAPILPLVTESIFNRFGAQPKALFNLHDNFYNLVPGTPVVVGDILFTKIETNEDKEQKMLAAKAAKDAKKSANKKPNDDPNQPDFTKLDIRVGHIKKVWNHEAATKLYCEEIDIGEEVRNVASGLRANYSLEEMNDRRVLIVCNLKPAKMVGFESCGMVLAAKSADGETVELVTPPADAKIGEKVYIDGLSGEPWTASRVSNKKVFPAVAVTLKVNSDGQLTWNDELVQTSVGPCSVPTVRDAMVS